MYTITQIALSDWPAKCPWRPSADEELPFQVNQPDWNDYYRSDAAQAGILAHNPYCDCGCDVPRLRAEFAMRQPPRGPEYAEGLVLRYDQDWHTEARSTGGSYRPGGPAVMFAEPNESRADFERRVRGAARAYND